MIGKEMRPNRGATRDRKPAIKMVALDLDGTALNGEGRLSPRTKEAFRKAKEGGTDIVIATGRTLHSLPQELFETEGLEYLITSNGARITDTKSDRIHYENLIDEGTVKRVHDFLRERGALIEVFYGGQAYIGEEEYKDVDKGNLRIGSREYILRTRKPVEDIFALLLENAGKIENININFTDMKEKRGCGEALAEIEGITLTSSLPWNYEIGGATTSKADAIAYLLKERGIAEENLMACGDSPNDLAMIRMAAVGVAMGNGEEVVKRAADIIAPPNYEDGVAVMIERFVLK